MHEGEIIHPDGGRFSACIGTPTVFLDLRSVSACGRPLRQFCIKVRQQSAQARASRRTRCGSFNSAWLR